MAGKAGELRIPLTLQRSRLKAEEKTLDFEFEVVSAQFNRQGRYALRLTVENPLLQGSSAGVRLCINSREVIQSSTGTTDTIEQSDLNQIYSFQRRKFTFILPRGFCKNDNNHDVRLHIEALHFPGRAERMRRSRQVGEAFFAIYPRTNQPRMKLSARKDEDWYRYSSVMALLRVGSEQPAMHCGRLAFTASLHEHWPPTTLVSPPPLSPSTQEEDQQAAGTAPASPPLDIPIPSCSPRTPESLDLVASPQKMVCFQSPWTSWQHAAGGGHVAHMGKEAITVILHSASNLPATREGQVPWPYVIVKTGRGDEQKAEATRASLVPTHAPTWEEEVTVEMDAEDAGWAGESVGRTVGTGMLGTGTWVSPYPRVNLGLLGSPCSKAPQAAPRIIFLLSPKMSQPAGPPEQPTWDTSFLFQGRDVATLFSEDTALAIEYYPYKTSTLIPVGYSVLPLTSRVFRELVARSGEMRVDGLAVQVSRGLREQAPTAQPGLAGGAGPHSACRCGPGRHDAGGAAGQARYVMGKGEVEIGGPLSLAPSPGRVMRTWHGAVAATLKHKLVAGTADMRRLKDRVQRLQNELIRKNDQEKDLVLLQRAHRQQQAVLRRCQEKVAKTKSLEETVRQQEKVSWGGGMRLGEERGGCSTHPSAPPSPHPTGEALSREVYAVLLAENRRLREDLARPSHLLPPVIPQPPTLPVRPGRGTQGWCGWGQSHGTPKSNAGEEPAVSAGQAGGGTSPEAGAGEAGGHRPPAPCLIMGGPWGVRLGWGAPLAPCFGKSQLGLGPSQLEEAARRWGREKQELGTRLLEREHGFPYAPTTVSTLRGDDQGHPTWKLRQVPSVPSSGMLTCMRKSCISSSAIRRPRHWRGPKPKPSPLKCLGPAASQRWGLNCSGLGKTSGSRPMA
uniref:C2 domain-containing protein n=1 Tax=Buteo japonicus TaxID=224669 RepID=A0A8C0AQI8_9AVES